MKLLSTKILSTAVILTGILCSPISNAAMVVYNAPLANPFTFSSTKGIMTFSYSGPTLSQIAAGDDNPISFANQSYNTVGDAIETVFGLAANTFADESVVDDTSTTFKGDISGNSTTIISDMAYNYLAVHLGGYEVFFHFAQLVTAGTEFKISGISTTKLNGKPGGGGGLSNYRVYNSDVSEVPLPAAAFLFAPALLGFMGLRRKAKNLVA